MIVPCSIQAARALVDRVHRHHRAPQGALFAVGYSDGNGLIGAAIIGRPIARKLQDGFTAEVTRVVVPTGYPNACSELYGACRRAAKALGYRRLITYTLGSESGASLRGAGWKMKATSPGGSWSNDKRPREDKHPLEAKVRWEAPL